MHVGKPFSKSLYSPKPFHRTFVLSSTVKKRKYIAKHRGIDNYIPRQCRHVKKNQKQCKLMVISSAVNHLVRCRHHSSEFVPFVDISEEFLNEEILCEGELFVEDAVPSDTIKPSTRHKRTYRAKLRNCCIAEPRQCRHRYSEADRECSVKVISSAQCNSLVRCRHHPLKDIKLAEMRGTHNSSYLPYVTCKPSNIQNGGMGVFTTDIGEYQPGDIITEYQGKPVTIDDIKRKHYNKYYTIKCCGFHKPYLSGIMQPEDGLGLGSFVNRGTETGEFAVNVDFHFSKAHHETVWLRATKFIGPNQELFAKYGPGFRC
jgi:hypothetical protein